MAKKSAERERVNPFGKVPPPRGGYNGPIPKSTKYVPPSTSNSEIDEQEATAFRRGVEIGDEMPQDARNRRVSQAALDPKLLTAAQRWMRGVKLEEDDNESEGEDSESSEAADEPVELTREMFDKAVQEQVQRVFQAQQEKLSREAQTQAPVRSATAAAPAHPAAEFDPTMRRIEQNGKQLMGNASGIIRHPSGLSIAPLTLVDIDRLWDWIRADDDRGKSFLSRDVRTSIELHQYMMAIVNSEKDHLAMIRAVHGGDQHLGFAMLAPILAEERTAIMHVYLQKEFRGSLAQIVGPLVDMAQAVVPGVHLAVWSPDDTWARLHRKLLTPHGFTERVMFIR